MYLVITFLVLNLVLAVGCGQSTEIRGSSETIYAETVSSPGIESVRSPTDTVQAYFAAAKVNDRAKLLDLIQEPAAPFVDTVRTNQNSETHTNRKGPSNTKTAAAQDGGGFFGQGYLVDLFPNHLREFHLDLSKIQLVKVEGDSAIVEVELQWPEPKYPEDEKIVFLSKSTGAWRITEISVKGLSPATP